jgi:hypothetical protein
MPHYNVLPAAIRPEVQGKWHSPAWEQAETLELTHFRPEGSDHRPKTAARLLYDHHGIFGIFRVDDHYVRCRHTAYMEPVYLDSCVEFFVQPKPDKGYFNLEFNCGGALLCSHINDPARTPDGFLAFVNLPEDDGKQVIVYHSLPPIVEPEITGPTVWFLEFFIPLGLLEKYVGPVGKIAGQVWRANFFKCGDETSHPHWSSWTRLPERNFHLPEYFGTIRFL